MPAKTMFFMDSVATPRRRITRIVEFRILHVLTKNSPQVVFLIPLLCLYSPQSHLPVISTRFLLCKTSFSRFVRESCHCSNKWQSSKQQEWAVEVKCCCLMHKSRLPKMAISDNWKEKLILLFREGHEWNTSWWLHIWIWKQRDIIHTVYPSNVGGYPKKTEVFQSKNENTGHSNKVTRPGSFHLHWRWRLCRHLIWKKGQTMWSDWKPGNEQIISFDFG